MAMEIAKTFVVNAAPEKVWSFLTDLPRVARCLPGAAIGEQLDAKTSTGTMTIKVGPVSSTYRGKVVFERLDPGARTAEIVASGQDVRGKGGADLRLTSSLKPLPGGQTEVTAVSLVNVTGLLAQMGRGMIQDVSDEMFQIFSERMRAELEGNGASSAATGAGVAGGGRVGGTGGVPSAPAAASGSGVAGGGRVGGTGGVGSPPAVVPSVAEPTLRPGGASAQSSPPEALDAAALGARVARRQAARWARQPAFWAVAVLIVGGVVWWLLQRSS